MSLISLTAVGNVEPEILGAIQEGLPGHLGMPVKIAAGLPEPDYAFDTRRGQYSSVAIMHELVKQRVDPGSRVLGITERDLFIPMLSFIYGQAQLDGSIALVSLARLRQDFYQLPANPRLLVLRTVKECIHELGHTFGLVHCPDRACPMSLATNIRQLDIKGSDCCTTCAGLIREAIARRT